MATANPAMNEAVYRRAGQAYAGSSVMTLEGTVVKTAGLLIVLVATAGYTWYQATIGSPLTGALMAVGAIGGFITAMATIFFPKASPISAPIYAALEGLVLGAISASFNAKYHGIVFQAVGVSIGVLAMMLFVYGTGLIRVTDKFRIGLVSATGAVCLVYVADMLLAFFGIRIPYIHESGLVGIGFSVVVVIIAALNLVLDFDFISRGVQLQAPKYMEWYGGFSLLVTLVWMYLEILRLLSKLQWGSRN
ncbi:MAG TPA: Bax inhibitor-1/YccA family protein [Planctomycetaceae bacterium]|jgi:uncharacterized YccA/Bax inhibitor family protein|nr:Bax inhibitor-1/YccA family protein [Planctomycetaceae bacterium]